MTPLLSLLSDHFEWHPPAPSDEVEDESEGDDDDGRDGERPAQRHHPARGRGQRHAKVLQRKQRPLTGNAVQAPAQGRLGIP